MKVILTQNVKFLGEAGEIKEVADGHALNYLLPQGLAVLATAENLQQLAAKRSRKAKQAIMELKEAEALARQLDGLELTIAARASDQGKLYAAVTPAKICDILKKRKFHLKASQIFLNTPIKELGEYEAVINLPHGLEAKISLTVKVE